MSAAPWSPYGLEVHRVALLQRRQRLLAAALLLGGLALLALLATTIQQSDDITTFGSGGNSVNIDLPTDRPRPKPTTLTVSPGRTSVLNQPIQPELRPARDNTAVPVVSDGLNLWPLLTSLAPVVLGGLYLWWLGRKRLLGPIEQVNFGVYKGAMPLEMHSAVHKGYIFTRAQARAHLFGRRSADFLPAGPLVVGRTGAAAARRAAVQTRPARQP